MRVRRENIRSGRKGHKRLKARVGWDCCISRVGLDRPDYTVKVYKLEGSEKEVTVLVGLGSPEEAGGSPRSESCQEF